MITVQDNLTLFYIILAVILLSVAIIIYADKQHSKKKH